MDTNAATDIRDTTPYQRAECEIGDIIQWVDAHDFDVDADAFREACAVCLLLACRARGVPRPIAIPAGVPTLALACDILGTDRLPCALAVACLPGGRAYRKALLSED